MARLLFNHADFLDAALGLVAERGPSAATVGAITGRLKAPTGSFYHRFASREALLAELWFKTVLGFQEGIEAALDAGDGLRAALHTPAWVRTHLDEARLLLLYHRDDFVQGAWPDPLLAGLAEQKRSREARIGKFALDTFGRAGPDELRCVRFVLAEMPVAAVRQHLYRREPPPPVVDQMIRDTYHAVVAGHRGRVA
jgi:AcrR family transcriptional regulator